MLELLFGAEGWAIGARRYAERWLRPYIQDRQERRALAAELVSAALAYSKIDDPASQHSWALQSALDAALVRFGQSYWGTPYRNPDLRSILARYGPPPQQAPAA